MKFFILLALLGATRAQPTFLADLDPKSASSSAGSFHIKLDNKLVEMEFANTNVGCGTTLDYGPGLNDVANTAQRFEQCEFYRVPHGRPSTCTNDPDLCTNGFTFIAAINPSNPTPDEGGTMWFYNAGFADNRDFGFRVGIQNNQAVARVITSTTDNRIECNLPKGKRGGYFTLAVIRSKEEEGDIRILVDGIRIKPTRKNCPTQSFKELRSDDSFVKYNEINIGGAKSFDKTAPDAALYSGLIDQVCFFPEALDISVVRNGDAPADGCFDSVPQQ